MMHNLVSVKHIELFCVSGVSEFQFSGPIRRIVGNKTPLPGASVRHVLHNSTPATRWTFVHSEVSFTLCTHYIALQPYTVGWDFILGSHFSVLANFQLNGSQFTFRLSSFPCYHVSIFISHHIVKNVM